jgi:hypothetical protein
MQMCVDKPWQDQLVGGIDHLFDRTGIDGKIGFDGLDLFALDQQIGGFPEFVGRIWLPHTAIFDQNRCHNRQLPLLERVASQKASATGLSIESVPIDTFPRSTVNTGLPVTLSPW